MLVQDPTKGNDVDAIFNQARQLGAVEGPLENLNQSSSSRSFAGTGTKEAAPCCTPSYKGEAVLHLPEPTADSSPLSSLVICCLPLMGLVVDETLPSTSIQLRLADETCMVAHFNNSNTVNDIRSFIDASRPRGCSELSAAVDGVISEASYRSNSDNRAGRFFRNCSKAAWRSHTISSCF
ncbi:PLANT UBX DOMAIN-CONTAINING PROTEIN 5 [Salix purpurea]|uniref:PLANT UBX DOMAIN-CONTAINING PROTEIN 5 n=1 Tax=Salix purpurea TaxID=77065 RepID=A0A9Q0WK89_SALPP|nr:PLANT UBX DOMAIN-CONTAINING PROTEIN 5 [Salix purpurea]